MKAFPCIYFSNVAYMATYQVSKFSQSRFTLIYYLKLLKDMKCRSELQNYREKTNCSIILLKTINTSNIFQNFNQL